MSGAKAPDDLASARLRRLRALLRTPAAALQRLLYFLK
ncbi:hypothetical protein PCH70_11470 [Pseudomonas cichorii JBC1]|nr:hypothetical protein PCH70_11470 [Pseudomonas cichorii JBC1]